RQGFAIRLRHVVRHRRLEDAQRLPELHRPALERAEHLEQLLGGLRRKRRADLLRALAGQPLAPPADRSPGDPEWQAGELGGTGGTLARHRGVTIGWV